MEEILHQRTRMKPCKYWDIYHINWWSPDFWTIKRSASSQVSYFHGHVFWPGKGQVIQIWFTCHKLVAVAPSFLDCFFFVFFLYFSSRDLLVVYRVFWCFLTVLQNIVKDTDIHIYYIYLFFEYRPTYIAYNYIYITSYLECSTVEFFRTQTGSQNELEINNPLYPLGIKDIWQILR